MKALVLLAFVANVAAAELPSFADVRASYVSSDAQLLDRNGTPIASAVTS